MVRNYFVRIGVSLAVVGLSTGVACAGGFSRQSQDFDILFQDGTQVQTGVTFVAPQRKLENIHGSAAAAAVEATHHGLNPATGEPFATSTDESESYFVPFASVKYDLTPDVACAAQYRQPFGAHTDVGTDNAIALSAIDQKIDSYDLGLNCSYKFGVGPGFVRVLGGVSYQHLTGYQTQYLPYPLLVKPYGVTHDTTGILDVSDGSYGWRAGLAYEIPDIALRAQLVYQSEVRYDLTGTVSGLLPSPIDIGSDVALPQSMELKLQTGIAPGWLAFGSVKWEDWSIEKAIVFSAVTNGAEVTRLNLYYRDGWTVTGGVGHKFNDALSLAGYVTWDRGVSTGYSSLSDTWLFGLSGAYTPTPNVELRLTGILGVMTGGFKDDTVVAGVPRLTGSIADFDADLVSGLSLSAKVKF